MIVIVLGFAAMVHGAAADFLASDAWPRLSPWISTACTALGLYLLLRRRGLANLRNEQGPVTYL